MPIGPLAWLGIGAGTALANTLFGGDEDETTKTETTQTISPEQRAYIMKMLQRESELYPMLMAQLGQLPGVAKQAYQTATREPAMVHNQAMKNLLWGR